MKDFKDRVAYISGAGGGIGLGIARALAKRGAKLAIADVQADILEGAREELTAMGASVLALQLDVADRKAIYAAADRIEDHFGGVHLAFNNAGVGYLGTPLDQVPDETFDWVVNVNLIGVMSAMKAFVPKIRKHGQGGHIVNTSSMAGLVVEKGWHTGIYSATKMGVIALSQDMRESLEVDGIGVSTFCVGLVKTNLEKNTGKLQPGSANKIPDAPDLLQQAGMSIDEAGEIALRGIENNDFYILTHPNLWPHVERYHDDIRQAFLKSARELGAVLGND
jgi:NAD(P)-dependent dehydrogenase (short-subunit alcohol dehydrogenase family)